MGGASKVAEPTGDFLCKKIAVQVQNDLDEYMANNPEFPVSMIWLECSHLHVLIDRLQVEDRKLSY